MTKLGVLTQMV